MKNFKLVKDIDTINIIEANIETIKANILSVEADVNLINQSFLPINGSKAMQGDLDMGTHQLSKLDVKEGDFASVRVSELRFGSATRRGLANPLGRALLDSSNQSKTNLTINYGPDWENTHIGGNVYLDNVKTTSSNGSLLLVDNSNQITKSNTLIDSLLSRITDLENKSALGVPIGMIAIWGKPAPFPEGWEEYVPLKGKMPVGLNTSDSAFNTLLGIGGNKEKTLTKQNIPSLDITIPVSSNDNSGGSFVYFNATDVDYEGDKQYSGVVNKGNIATAINILNPYRTVYFIEYTGKSSDTTKPTSPANLKTSNIGTKSLTLNWAASTDNVGVTNYLIYKDNNLLETIGNILSYSVTGLSKGTSYDFYVIAKDAAGNLSAPSNILNVRTIAADLTAPTVPAYFTCFNNGQGNIGLQWATSIDDDSPVTYELSRKIASGPFIVFKTTLDTYHYEVGSPNTKYSYKVRAIDPSGNASDYKEATITLNSF